MLEYLERVFREFLMLIAVLGVPVMCGFWGMLAIVYLLDKYDGEESLRACAQANNNNGQEE